MNQADEPWSVILIMIFHQSTLFRITAALKTPRGLYLAVTNLTLFHLSSKKTELSFHITILCLKSQCKILSKVDVYCYMEQLSVSRNLQIKSPAFHVNISQIDHDNTCAEKGGLGPSNYIPCKPLGFVWDSRMNWDIERAIVFKEKFVYNKCHLHLTFTGRLQSINQALTAPCTGVRRLSHIAFSTKLSCVENRMGSNYTSDFKKQASHCWGASSQRQVQKRFPIASQIP